MAGARSFVGVAGIIALSVIGLAAPALAIHVFDPPWVTDPGNPYWDAPNSNGSRTSQGWEFGGNPSPPSTPTNGSNPFGTPQYQPVTSTYTFDPNGPGFTGVFVWHVDVDGGGFILNVPNDPTFHLYKDIELQYTSSKASLGAPGTAPGGTASAGGVAGHANGYYTYEWHLHLEPNPPFEQIFVAFPQSTFIEEVWVETISHNPEPGSLVLLSAAGLLMFRRRRAA